MVGKTRWAGTCGLYFLKYLPRSKEKRSRRIIIVIFVLSLNFIRTIRAISMEIGKIEFLKAIILDSGEIKNMDSIVTKMSSRDILDRR